jgi:hypothetical protein
MLIKIKHWYNGLSNSRQLLLLFIAWWTYWLCAWLLVTEFFLDEEPYTVVDHVIHATWMGTIFLFSFNWNKVKQLFKRKVPGKEQ